MNSYIQAIMWILLFAAAFTLLIIWINYAMHSINRDDDPEA